MKLENFWGPNHSRLEGQGKDWSFIPKTWEATEEFYMEGNNDLLFNSFVSKIVHHKMKKNQIEPHQK